MYIFKYDILFLLLNNFKKRLFVPLVQVTPETVNCVTHPSCGHINTLIINCIMKPVSKPATLFQDISFFIKKKKNQRMTLKENL